MTSSALAATKYAILEGTHHIRSEAISKSLSKNRLSASRNMTPPTEAAMEFFLNKGNYKDSEGVSVQRRAARFNQKKILTKDALLKKVRSMK